MCDQCRTMHSERRPPTEPPCRSCRVDLMPENRDAAEIYLRTRRQVVTYHNGAHDVIIDIDHNAIKVNMDLRGIKEQEFCFQKVTKVFREQLKDLKQNG